MEISGSFKKVAAKIAAISLEKWKKVVGMISGWGFWGIWNWWLDNVLFPGAIAGMGVINGGLTMTGAAALNNFVWLAWYEYKKMSWVGDSKNALEDMFKWTKRVMNHKYKYFLVKMLVYTIFLIPGRVLFPIALWCIAKGGIRAFFALSCFTDSFVTTAYFRRNANTRFGLNDSYLFLASTIVSCAYWTMRSWGLVETIRFAWKTIQVLL